MFDVNLCWILAKLLCNTFGQESIWDAFRDLEPFAQFKKCKKHPRSVTFSIVKFHTEAFNFTKSNTPPWVLVTFFRL